MANAQRQETIRSLEKLWIALQAFEGHAFYTAKGLQFTYVIKGNEMFVDRKDKSITRSTVQLAYEKAVELNGTVSGPKKLGCFGASYLYPVFVHLGIIVKKEGPAFRKGNKRTVMNYRAFLFDFDGTLVDSMPTYVATMLHILDENNIAYGDDIVKIITPLGYIGTARYYRELGVPLSEEEMIRQMHRYAKKEYALKIPAKQHVIEVLKKLHEQGYRLNVLTASPHEMLDPCLKRLGLYDLFDFVWSCEDFNTTKADPEIYRLAAERIGVPIEDILFLDDNYNADRCAKEAGIGVCGVYDESSTAFEEEIRAVSDYYIKDFEELLHL